ncbi:hypothetical protein KP509_17G067000 [Ceratopteris richardii]|uniref:EF-hand domain-containing protein n=1 Tax=Ceratopteris richardii TaxID=49495 RepID=A0A8T2SYK4_CERRI|nr:hypothetical protein KP509_17G067000 [Ceratopteris richardii]
MCRVYRLPTSRSSLNINSADQKSPSLTVSPSPASAPIALRKFRHYLDYLVQQSIASLCRSFEMAITNKDDPQILHCIFQIFDEDRDGCESADELLHSFWKLGMKTSKCSIHSLFSQLPHAPSDRLSKKECQDLYETICAPAHEFEVNDSSTLCNVEGDEELIASFHVFDKDREGCIFPTELQTLLRSLGFL